MFLQQYLLYTSFGLLILQIFNGQAFYFHPGDS